MTARTYVELFEHVPKLGVRYESAAFEPWAIVDERRGNETYSRAATLPDAVRFIMAAYKQGDADVDMRSIDFAVLFTDLHSVRVGALPERELDAETQNAPLAEERQGGSASRASRSANVLPFERVRR